MHSGTRPQPIAETSTELSQHGSLDGTTATLLAETFKALGDPTRVRIVSMLAEAELCVCDLAAALDLSQSAVSHQLRTLRDLSLVRRRRDGRHAFYALDDEHVVDLYLRGLEHVAHGQPSGSGN